MKFSRTRPWLFDRKGSELNLSGAAMGQLLRGVLEKGASCRFRATGLSMYPFIKDGDVLTVSPLKGFFPRFGDVVAFTQPETGKLVVHRVIGKRRSIYLIRGDNANNPDGFLSKDNILGWVSRVERGGRSVSLHPGPARFFLALLNRTGLLSWLLFLMLRIIRSFKRGPALE